LAHFASAAFAFFADQAVNAAVVEVGLGGRLDSTNVVDAEVCVGTSIGVDHTEFLGEDLASIAAEKVAIAVEFRLRGQRPQARLPTREDAQVDLVERRTAFHQRRDV